MRRKIALKNYLFKKLTVSRYVVLNYSKRKVLSDRHFKRNLMQRYCLQISTRLPHSERYFRMKPETILSKLHKK